MLAIADHRWTWNWLGVVALVVCGLTAPAFAQPERVIAAEAALEDVRLARRAVEMIHSGLTRYSSAAEIGAAFDGLEAACGAPMAERELFARLSVVLAKIRCSHTKVEPSKAWEAWRAEAPTYLPFRFFEDSGRMIVRRGACEGVEAGDEVVSIDGVSAARVMATIMEAVPADGWTDGARRFALSSSSDFDDSELDHFFPAFFGAGPVVRLEVRRPGSATTRSVEAALMTREARRAALAEPAPARNLDEAVSLEMRPGAAVLRVGTFVAYRKPIKPEAIYRPFFERLAAEKVGTLILDLRENGGGSDSAAIDLARFLVDGPLTVGPRTWVRTFRFGDLAEKLETWDPSVLKMPEEDFKDLGNGYYEMISRQPQVFEPLSPGFRGRVIVLCGPANASGATMFMAGLREKRKVMLVGETTGGSAEGPTAGIVLFLPLTNSGLRVRIPALRTVTGFEGASPMGGLEPDIEMRPTLEERVTGKDGVLERVLEMLAEQE